MPSPALCARLALTSSLADGANSRFLNIARCWKVKTSSDFVVICFESEGTPDAQYGSYMQ